jgi:tRNA(fMet)-specific endonuclease VapC
MSQRRYMLDTSTVSELVRNPLGAAAQHYRKLSDERVCTSIIVAAELRYGVHRKGRTTLALRVEQALQGLQVLPFEAPADDIYGSIRASLERLGSPIGNFDLLIAAHALATDCILVTDNVREFQRVPKLRVENWLRG